jgi:GLPGLI family protein
MKKLFLLFTCLTLVYISAKAQKADVATAMVRYKFSQLKDTTKPDVIYNENMMLLLGKNATAYKSYDRKLADAAMRKQLQEQVAAQAGSGGAMKITMNRSSSSGTSTEYYQFANEHKLIRKEKLLNSYLIEEPLPVIDWKITGDTASFAGLHCQKATTHFKGRDYTAWFCPEIPVHAGPWKLSGLPGLILEAYDTKKQVVFKFDGIEDMSKMEKPAASAPSEMDVHVGGGVKIFGMDDPNADPRAIELPADGIKTNEKEFNQLKDAMRKDPQAFMQSAMAGSGANFKMNGAPSPNVTTKIQVASGPVENNPIELPEKK